MKLFSHGTLLTLGALIITFAPQAEGQCSNATMKGTYVASGTGTAGAAAPFSPIATVSLVIYNGDGTGVVVYSTKTVAGVSSTSSNVPAYFYGESGLHRVEDPRRDKYALGDHPGWEQDYLDCDQSRRDLDGDWSSHVVL
jgi:hypothetical protein